ncbi:MAG: FAD-binding oxidoreductase [Sphingobium sp.]|nr:FAD-binding oxidoreductase [Sphingobium sp.]
MTGNDLGALYAARERFTSLLGAGAVLADGVIFDEFRDPFEGPEAQSHRAALVIQPETVDQVQAALAVANELKVHLWTSSMGRNYGYGGSAPVKNGAIVLNLRRMNRILEINAQQGYALIEPGVSFHQLYQALRDEKIPLMMSVPDLGWGSIIGNALEHGYGYNILGDHSSALCGLETVLADGTLLRTGQGAIPNSPLWSCHRRGFGPSLDDLFKQSNFGVVTKAGLWLMPQPEVKAVGTILCQQEHDIVPLIEAMRPLLQEGILQGIPMIVGTPVGDDVANIGQGRFTVANLRTVLRPGRWNVRFGFYGRADMVSQRQSILQKAIHAVLPNAEIELRTYAGDAGPDEVEPRDYISAGIPNQVLLDRLRSVFGETFGHMDVSPVIPFTGEAALRLDQAMREIAGRHGVLGPVGMLCNPRSMVAACMLMFDASDPDQVKAARNAARDLYAQARDWGCAPYRSHVALVDEVAETFSFNDDALGRMYSKIKNAIDPVGILSPGNHGIWPDRSI